MIDLQKEAEEYAKDMETVFVEPINDEHLRDFAVTDFIAGANSKFVQAEKLKAQIEVLEKIKIAVSVKNTFTIQDVATRIKNIQEQLQLLENDTNRNAKS